jgi:perosamine synthetase
VIPLAVPSIGQYEKEAVNRVLESGILAQGPEVAAFENEFSATVQGRHCVAVNSGTSALHLGLLAAGIGPGDEVIVPSFTFAATANAVALSGATPVFVDIDPATYCMSPEAVAEAIGPRTTALLPVHLFGHPADLPALIDLAQRNGLMVFEDAAQAHLAEHSGIPVGCHGSFAAFSFYPTKNMTTGEGGMVVTEDDEIARKVRLLRNQGMETRYENEIVGFNARMTDIAAAIGRVQLNQLAKWTDMRRKNAAFLDENLKGVTTPVCRDEVRHVYHQYTVRSEQRQDLIGRLESSRIGFAIFYEHPVHRLPAFCRTDLLRETDRAAASVVSLPVHPQLSQADLNRIVEVVNG